MSCRPLPGAPRLAVQHGRKRVEYLAHLRRLAGKDVGWVHVTKMAARRAGRPDVTTWLD